MEDSFMNILWTILIGFIVGLVARFVMPGRDPAGFILTTLLGIGGAFLGKYLGQMAGFYATTQIAGFAMSVVGSLLLLFTYNKLLRA
jgi:uncharacterized membrane protein YeaQ/YmgE (transglycosylase-associated protein family)